MAVMPAQVSAFLGNPGDAHTTATATQVVPVITAMVKAYVRGGIGWEANDEIEAVILSASARLVTNTGQIPVDFSTGDFGKSLRGAFNGWTTAELAVLNRYRKRAA